MGAVMIKYRSFKYHKGVKGVRSVMSGYIKAYTIKADITYRQIIISNI